MTSISRPARSQRTSNRFWRTASLCAHNQPPKERCGIPDSAPLPCLQGVPMVHCLSRKLSCPKRRRKILSLGKENGCPRTRWAGRAPSGWAGPVGHPGPAGVPCPRRGTLTRRGQRPTHWKEIPMKKPLENRRGVALAASAGPVCGDCGRNILSAPPRGAECGGDLHSGAAVPAPVRPGGRDAGPPTTLTDYDQAAVLACLSRYQEQRTLEKADGQEEDAGRFTMVLDVNGETETAGAGGGVLQLWGRRVEIPHPKRKPPPTGPGEAVEPPRLCITPERGETGLSLDRVPGPW